MRVELVRAKVGLPADAPLIAHHVVEEAELQVGQDALTLPVDALDLEVVRISAGRD